MHSSTWREVAVGAVATSALLGGLSFAVDLGPVGWVVGVLAGCGASAAHAVARRRCSQANVGPADRVTLTRAMLVAGIAALVVADRSGATTTLVVLASIALLLDCIDGQVARRTRTTSVLGARFDAEVDAFLILVLSIDVSRDYGGWVLAIGAARYVFLLVGWVLPWLAAPLTGRFWGKTVAAVQGIVLTVAAAGVLSHLVGMATVAIALILLVSSFAHSIFVLYRSGAGAHTRIVVQWSSAIAAALVVWVVLVAPDRLDELTLATFARIPLEGLIAVALWLVLPQRPRRVLAVTAGVAFALITVVKVFDMAFNAQLDRPFNLVSDWGNLVLGIGVVRDSVGPRVTDEFLVLAALGLVALIAAIIASTLRLSSMAAGHRRRSAQGITVLGVAWIITAAMSLQTSFGASVASLSTAQLAVAQVDAADAAIRDQQQFEATLHSADPSAKIPASDLLAGLRGKDVLLVFVESYGQVAVQGASYSPAIDTALRSETTTLAHAGFFARSAFLTSPTFGGLSWIAHATLQSGLWIDSQQRYDQLMTSNRLSISSEFGKAGWRTVSDNPADKHPWLQGKAFYHYAQLYGRYNVAYRGPRFSWADMPDQYTLAKFQHNELGPGHAPVMAEMDLVSSHTPWTPLPRMVPWDRLGDGSIFDSMPAQGLSPATAWQSSATVSRLYGQSIRYSMDALTSWIARVHDKNLVVMLLGDHQPATTVSGYNATHDVPISIVAHDPSVLNRIAPWHWQSGLLPSPSAPVWRMDAFRNKFLGTFSSSTAALSRRANR